MAGNDLFMSEYEFLDRHTNDGEEEKELRDRQMICITGHSQKLQIILNSSR
jgi:hypothetical protein